MWNFEDTTQLDAFDASKWSRKKQEIGESLAN